MKHFFFDLDRTIWDFDKNSKEALLEIHEKYKLSEKGVFSKNEFVKTYKEVNEHFWEKYRKKEVTKEELRKFRFHKTLQHFGYNNLKHSIEINEYYVHNCPKKTHLEPGARDTLEYLKQKDYKLHIISNGFSSSQAIKMESNKLTPYFDVILCSDTIGVNKPNPKIFLEALKQAKANVTESVMIGDDLKTDITGARRVGMNALHYAKNKKESKGVINHLQQITKLY